MSRLEQADETQEGVLYFDGYVNLYYGKQVQIIVASPVASLTIVLADA